jgi:hypothetical protein
MRPDRSVMAAPNRSEIKAKVLQKEQSQAFRDKWYLELQILESKDLHGPNFARAGERVKGFTFGDREDIPQGSIITAQAEFLGDARGGQFQLSDVAIVEQ